MNPPVSSRSLRRLSSCHPRLVSSVAGGGAAVYACCHVCHMLMGMADAHEHGRQHPKMIGRAEAAQLFGVDPQTVWRWGRSGKIPTWKSPTGRVMYYEKWCLDNAPAAASDD